MLSKPGLKKARKTCNSQNVNQHDTINVYNIQERVSWMSFLLKKTKFPRYFLISKYPFHLYLEKYQINSYSG